MESKLNEEALIDYCKAYSEKVLGDFFEKNDRASGEDILALPGVRQVNLFAIFHLMRKWEGEVSRLESPYFDFKNKEVKRALREFANVLSRHISLSRDLLSTLLELAIHDTLQLFLSPYDFYCNYISNWEYSRIKTKDLKSLSKYVKINQNLIISYVERLEKEDNKEFMKEDALKILNEVFEKTNQSPEDIDPFISQFSSIVSLDVNAIYGEEIKEAVRSEKEKPKKTEEKSKTLNDQLSKEGVKTIADIHEKKALESIKSNLTINQKFMFVNQLFNGNMDDFNQVVNFLDNCRNQAEAMEFINNNYLKKNSWNKDSTEVREFIEVIAKKYA